MRLFLSGFLLAAALVVSVAEVPGIRVTWTHAERVIQVHGRTVLAVYPAR
jgi:hypothetical protein